MSEAAVHSRAGGTVAIVTGASRALGRDVVLELARRRCAVVAVYLRGQAAAEVVVEAVDAAGGTALAVRADVTDALDVERLFDETISAFGVVDVIVHAARPDARELLEQAVRRLRRGGAVLILSAHTRVGPALTEALRASGVRVSELPPGFEPCRDDELAELAGLLRPWHDGPGLVGPCGHQ